MTNTHTLSCSVNTALVLLLHTGFKQVQSGALDRERLTRGVERREEV